MPLPPKPVPPGQVIDPRRNGDDHAIKPPQRDQQGRPVSQIPLRDHDGRHIPPSQTNITIINNTTIVNNITNNQRDWDRNDHDYHWHDWDGRRICHHYDEFGYHNWGFYVGSVYFWTRYHDDRYWWYDPYWRRWTYLHEGQWWWQDDSDVIYVYNGGSYYRYDGDDTAVVITPDPTPPVVIPPGPAPTPAPIDQTTVYSLDGTRSIQITGDNRDAYLYDLTVADPRSTAGQGRYIGTQVAGVKIDYVTQTAGDGTETKTIQQIELTYDDSSSFSVVDFNGKRRVDVSGDAMNATLTNLVDNTIDPVDLGPGVSSVNMYYEPATRGTGQVLQSIVLNVTDDSGNPATLTCDRNGAWLNPPAPDPSAAPSATRAAPPTTDAQAVQSLQQKMRGSETFRALKDGFGW